MLWLKREKVINRRKGSETMNEVNPAKTNKNLKSFLEISLIQKEVFLHINFQDHAYCENQSVIQVCLI